MYLCVYSMSENCTNSQLNIKDENVIKPTLVNNLNIFYKFVFSNLFRNKVK